MASVRAIYDGMQHCIAMRDDKSRFVAMDCPYTGKGEEFSPMNLLGSSLAGCMLLSMGALAMRNQLDIAGTTVTVDVQATDSPKTRVSSIDVAFNMPKAFSDSERKKLEGAAHACPIEHSFDPDIPIAVRFEYPA